MQFECFISTSLSGGTITSQLTSFWWEERRERYNWSYPFMSSMSPDHLLQLLYIYREWTNNSPPLHPKIQVILKFKLDERKSPKFSDDVAGCYWSTHGKNITTAIGDPGSSSMCYTYTPKKKPDHEGLQYNDIDRSPFSSCEFSVHASFFFLVETSCWC